MMTTKEELRKVVDALDDAEAAELLKYAHWLRHEGETLTEEDLARVVRGEEQLQRGESIPWDKLRHDPDL